MRLSILLPTHNEPTWCVSPSSLCSPKNGTDFELQVCGDGCTDGPLRWSGAWSGRTHVSAGLISPRRAFRLRQPHIVLREARVNSSVHGTR